MKLYEVPKGSWVRVLEETFVAPVSLPVNKGDILELTRADGMHSLCYKDGLMVHPSASTEVEIINEKK